MSNREEDQPRGFKVQDRRRFTAEGESRPEEAAAPEASAASAAGEAAAAPEAQQSAPEPPPPPPPAAGPAGPYEINFSTFLISLGTQALAYLGEIPNPLDRSHSADLGAAKEMIDIISMLKEKTHGNLEAGEQGLIESLLYDLRLKYVERVRSQSHRS